MKNQKVTKRLNKLLAFLLRLFRIEKLSVYQLTISLLIITAFFSVGFIFIGWTYTEFFRVKAKINDLKITSIIKQEKKLKDEVSRLIFYLEYIQKDTISKSPEQIKEEALLYFENIRFGTDGYIFVNTYEGIALLFDGQKLNGTKDITGLTDPNGFKIFEKELELAKLPEGGSFLYLFKKIYDATPQPKLSYVMGFDEWQWIIGTGDYLDNIGDEAFILEQGLKRDMYNNILIAFGIFLFVLFVLILAAYWFARWIQHQFNNVVINLRQAPLTKNVETLFEGVFINELKTIGFEILQVEQAVKIEHARFKNIMNINPSGIYIIDKQHNIEYTNPIIEKEFGPVDGRKCYAYFHDLSEECAWCKNKEVFAGKTIKWEWFSEKTNKHYDLFDTLLKNPDGTVSKFELFFDITKRKESENQLHSSQQRYSGLFENAPISLWEEDFSELIDYLDAQLKKHNLPIDILFEKHPDVLYQCAALVKVTDVNNQTLSLFEAKDKEELFGNLDKLFTENSIPAFKQSLLALYRGEKQYSSEGENLTLTGKKLDVFLRWSFLAKGEGSARKVIVSIVDLTELRKKEEDLFASEARFRSIFENNHTVMFLINPKNGRFIDANPAALNFYGYTRNHFVTELSVYDLNTLSQEETIAKMNEAKAKKQAVFNFKHQLANGDIRDVEVHSGIIQFANKPTLFSFVHDVTEKQQVEKARQRSEKRLKEAQRLAKIGNWELDLTANKLYWSDEVYRLFDLKPQQFAATYEAFLDNIHPDDRELVNKVYTESLKTKEPYDIVHRLLLKDGTIKFVHEHCETFYDIDGKAIRSVGTVQDITEKQKAKQDIEESKNKLESIFRAAPAGIGVVSDRVFTEVNERFCDMTGFSSKELIGKESAMIYLSLDEFERVGKEKYEQINEKGTGTVETRFKRKDGEIIDVLMSSTPLDMSDFTKGVTFTALDITERVEVLKELENHRNNLTEIVKDRTGALEESQNALLNLVDDLNRKSEELEETNIRLAEINEELETFTYSVSHDLKAPLRGIDGYSQLLLDDCKDDIGGEAREFLENIRKSTMQMSLLIEDLLAYSRMERKDFQTANVQLKPMVDNLVLTYAKTIDENKVQMKLSFPNAFVLEADKEGVNMVLRNLLDNALKFSTTKSAIQIEIGGSESDTHWHIFVKDNGIGFDMKYHDRIFKIFQRLHLAEEYEGTGIGLAMVSKAMQRMNGKIWAESEIGKGSCFYMEIMK